MTARRRLDTWQAIRWAMRALGGRIEIPLSIIRLRLADLSEKVAIEIQPDGPGLRLQGKAHALGAPIDFSARLTADGVHVRGEQRTVRIHFDEVSLSTEDDAPGPLADAIRRGAIDTAHPGTLIGNMVSLPDMVVEAHGQEVLVDLMKLPAIQRDPSLYAAVAAASSYLGVTAIEVSDDAIHLRLGLLPGGPKEAMLSSARAALTPVVHYLWPEGHP